MNFETAIEHVLAKEGGYSDNPNDSGNWTGGKVGRGALRGTKFGISAAAYPKLDIKNLTRIQAIAIYRTDYWARVRADEMPTRIRLHLFDFAVNAGVSAAIKTLQGSAGVKADGAIGPVTLQAAQRVTPWQYAKARAEHYARVVRTRPANVEFLAGWMIRTIDITEISLRT